MAADVKPDSPSPPWRIAVCSAVLAATTFALSLAVFEPAWDTDNTDDPRMALKVAGVASPLSAEPHLLYTHIGIGRTLAALHKVSPDVPWYGFYILLAQVLAWAAILDCVFHLTPQKYARVLAAGFAAVCVAWSVAHLQFTTTATIVATAGGLQIISAMRLENADANSRWGRVLFGWSLVAFSSAIRIQSCYLIGVVLIPAGLIMAWRLRKQIRLAAHIAIAGGGIAVVFGLVAIDRHEYEADAGWKAFREFERPFAILLNRQKVRQQYLGSDPLADEIGVSGEELTRHEAALARAGWNHDDLKLFLLWYSADPEIHTAESLQLLCEELVASPFSGKTRWLVMATTTVVKLARDRVFCLSLVFSIAMVLLFCEPADRKTCVALWLFVFALLALVLVALKLPERVTTPAGIATLFAVLATSTPAATPPSRASLQTAILILLLAGGWVLKGAMDDSQFAAEHRQAYVREFEALAKDSEHFHFMLQPGGFQLLSPLKTHRELDSLRYVYADGAQRSPTFAASREAAGISNVSHAIAFDRNVRLIGTEPRLTLLRRFLRRHYDVDVEFVPERTGRYFTVNSVTRKSETGSR